MLDYRLSNKMNFFWTYAKYFTYALYINIIYKCKVFIFIFQILLNLYFNIILNSYDMSFTAFNNFIFKKISHLLLLLIFIMFE